MLYIVILSQKIYRLTKIFTHKFYDLENSKNQSKSCGTLIYMDPEVIESEIYNSKADVFFICDHHVSSFNR